MAREVGLTQNAVLPIWQAFGLQHQPPRSWPIGLMSAEIAETLDMALSVVSGILARIGMGKLGQLSLEPA